MNKEMMKKAVASKVVDLAVQTSKMPNQTCFLILGKAKAKCDLTSDDYMTLATFMKRS